MITVTKKLDELYPTEKNVRRHPELQIKELERNYKKFGQYRPLVVSSDGEILVGNGLYEALKRMGAETVECVVLPPETSKADKQKLMLADNKIFELGSNDVSNIDELLESMNDFDIPGFDEETLKELYSEAESAIDSIDNLFTISPEKKEAINNVVERRRDEVPQQTAQASETESKPAVARAEAQEEHTGSYITCPHCGMKIYQ